MRISVSSFLLGLLASTAAVQGVYLNSTQEFKLRTKVTSGSIKFNDLFLDTYHTGAGSSDAVLTPNRTASANSYFDGTTGTLLVDLHNDFPYAWVPAQMAYTAWCPVYINGGTGTAIFAIENGELTYLYAQNAKMQWLACDWWHGVPQIFWYVGEYYDTPITSNCAFVVLKAEYI